MSNIEQCSPNDQEITKKDIGSDFEQLIASISEKIARETMAARSGVPGFYDEHEPDEGDDIE
jgi:hypothetical protein